MRQGAAPHAARAAGEVPPAISPAKHSQGSPRSLRFLAELCCVELKRQTNTNSLVEEQM